MLRYSKMIALAAGAVSATGFAPLGLWPLTLMCFALLIHVLITATNGRGVFVRGWLFAVGHFTVGLNWIAHAFTYQEAMPHWFGYGAVVALSLYLAVYPAIGGVAAWLLNPLPTGERAGAHGAPGEGAFDDSAPLPGRFAAIPLPGGERGVVFVLAFAAAWIATEWLRATLFTGFAWNPLGAVMVGQYLDLTSTLVGTYGLSGLVILLAGAIWLLALRQWRSAATTLAIVVPLIVAAEVARPGTIPPAGPLVRIVQPNVGQDEKHNPGAQVANLKRLVRMSDPPGAAPRLLLWPEAAIDNGFYLQEEPDLRRFLVRALGPSDMLLTGGVALEYDRSGRAIGGRNSVFAMGPDTRIHGRYDKSHLVPYGEYLPMREILTPLGLSRLVPGDLDFWPGPGPLSFDIPGVGRVGFQICYEIIFSGRVIDPSKRPLFLFNPSNDAWFGAWGPPQHLAQARLRAIEEGMTVVRATPTGISGVIDPRGRLIASIGRDRRAVLDARLPAAAAPTPFARFGNLLPALLAIVLAALAVVIRLRRR